MINASNGLFGKSKNKQYDCKPGFNEYVKDLHDTARKRFVAWREAKKPRDHNNPFFKEMTTSRARFKLALRFINPRARRSGPLDPQAWKICHSTLDIHISRLSIFDISKFIVLLQIIYLKKIQRFWFWR